MLELRLKKFEELELPSGVFGERTVSSSCAQVLKLVSRLPEEEKQIAHPPPEMHSLAILVWV